MNNEETTEYMKQRIELRRICDEEISPMIILGNYEGARNLLDKNPDIKWFLPQSQLITMYDYFVEGKLRKPLSEEELKKEELAYLASH